MQTETPIHQLSKEHRHALVLYRHIHEWLGRGNCDNEPEFLPEVGKIFERDLEPHFRAEEEGLLSTLEQYGMTELVERVRREHQMLRSQIQQAREGHLGAARAFADTLLAHVQFEERELHPTCQRVIPPAVLEQVAKNPLFGDASS